MSSKIDELSNSLDKINAGQTLQVADTEIDELLEVATLLHKAALPVRPPEHILSVTVQRAADGLAAHKKSRHNAWLYSGVLGAAAALLIFVGINGFPSMQEVVPIVTPAPQNAPVSSNASARLDVNPTTPVAPLKEKKTAAPESNAESSNAVSTPSSDTASKPATPSAPASATPSPALSSLPRQAPASAVQSMKVAFPPTAMAVRLAGRTPDSIIKDSSAGTIRQVFDSGTPRELIITQRIKPLAENDTAASSGQQVLRETAKGKSEALTSLNKVVVVINGQEVTLEGRQTIAELTELSKTLSPATM
ncbi:MAG TPA: hypothetical protein VN631_12305 [Negativicutes bacterium]|nr:hypothetical protein [Negativicutes bacterium]